jgi:HNH endonuclease
VLALQLDSNRNATYTRVIDLGRARRFTGAVRRALEVRDCTHRGCEQPAEHCQGDHIQPWAAGGTTTVDNGQLRCGYHNRWRWKTAMTHS